MSRLRRLALPALLAASAGLAVAQPPASPPPAHIDPVTVAAFTRGGGGYGRFDPGHDWHQWRLRPAVDESRDWSAARRGLPAFTPHGVLSADDPPPAPTVPFALLLSDVPTAPQLARLADMKHLRALVLPTGPDSTPAPRAMKQLAALTQLRDLALRVPPGDRLKPLAELKDLRRLNLALPEPAATDLRPVAALTDLRLLVLSGDKHDDDALAPLAGLRNLEAVTLAGFHLKGDGLKHLAGSDRLARLDFHDVTVTDAGLAPLADLPRLDALHFGIHQPVREGWFKAIGRAGTLRILMIPSCRLAEGEDPNAAPGWFRHLAGLKRLEVLDLSDCDLLGVAALRHVAEVPGLKDLRIGGSGFNGDEGLTHLGRLATLEILDLSGNRSFTGTGLKPLADRNRLRVLNLRGCDWVTADGLTSLGGCTSLEDLDVSDFDTLRPLTDDHLERVGQLTGLRVLRVERTFGITDDGLARLAGLKRLEHLDLSWNRLTGAGLIHLAALERLHTLRLAHVGSRGPLNLDALPRFKALRTLDLSSSILDEAGMKAAAAVPGLETLLFTQWGLRPLPTAMPASLTGGPAFPGV